jgi:Cu-processing system permease protein
MTFLEARRNRVTLTVVLFALAIVGASVVLEHVTTTALDRIVRDAGLAAIQVFGLIIAVFLGVSAVSREIERKTIYILVSKPLRRCDYVAGKLLGIALSLLATVGLMAVVFLIQQLLYRAPLRPVLLAACWLMLMELMVVATFSVFASSFTSPIMSAFMAVGLFLIGELSRELNEIGLRADPGVYRSILKGLFYILPDFQKLNLKSEAAQLLDVGWMSVLSATFYAGLYVACFGFAAMAILDKRDLK